MGIFETLGTAYEKAANGIVSGSISSLISQLEPAIAVGLTLYLMITAYMIIAGRIQDPIADVVIKICKWVIISFIALNAGTITSGLIGGFQGLEQSLLTAFGSQGTNSYEQLDKFIFGGLYATGALLEKANSYNILQDAGKICYCLIAAIIIFISVIIQTFLAGVIMILAKASLLVVFALAPLMLAGLFFPKTARFADVWPATFRWLCIETHVNTLSI